MFTSIFLASPSLDLHLIPSYYCVMRRRSEALGKGGAGVLTEDDEPPTDRTCDESVASTYGDI